MASEQIERLQREAERLRDRARAGHVETDDFVKLAQIVADLVARVASLEARILEIAE